MFKDRIQRLFGSRFEDLPIYRNLENLIKNFRKDFNITNDIKVIFVDSNCTLLDSLSGVSFNDNNDLVLTIHCNTKLVNSNNITSLVLRELIKLVSMSASHELKLSKKKIFQRFYEYACKNYKVKPLEITDSFIEQCDTQPYIFKAFSENKYLKTCAILYGNELG